jgi:hypothetical protein
MLHAVHASAVAEGTVAIVGAVAPLVAFGLGMHSLNEAHEKGEEQSQALGKDVGHVALIAALDLPASYKAGRFDGPYRHVPKENNTPAFRATEALKNDPKGLATLQLHADRGMNAARDVLASGLSASDYLKTHPDVAKSFMKDAAFREGFQAFMYAKATLPPDQMKAFEHTLDERDGWYAQSHIQFRA